MAFYSIRFKKGLRTALDANPLVQGEPFLATDTNNMGLLIGKGDGNNLEALTTEKYIKGVPTNTNKIDNALHADEATHATSADSTTQADHATNADHAASADVSTTSTTANHAGSADTATLADAASALTASAISALLKAAYQVGDIKLSTSNVNPGTYISGTTWAAWGSGRVPIGVGNNGTNNYTAADQTGGRDATGNDIQEAGVDASAVAGNTSWYSGTLLRTRPGQANTTGTAASYPLDIRQSYITCYMWKRIS